jgi:hypothetical protein
MFKLITPLISVLFLLLGLALFSCSKKTIPDADKHAELEILPLDQNGTFTWNLVYGEDKEKGLRPYVLETIDSSKGLYLIDEKNTIKIENYLLADKLTNVFEVAGSLIIVTIQKKGEYLVYEIIAGKSKEASVTGNAIYNGDSIPEVITYPLNVLQRALLTRQEE